MESCSALRFLIIVPLVIYGFSVLKITTVARNGYAVAGLNLTRWLQKPKNTNTQLPADDTEIGEIDDCDKRTIANSIMAVQQIKFSSKAAQGSVGIPPRENVLLDSECTPHT